MDMRTRVILSVWLLVLCILTMERDPILLTLEVSQLNKADDLRGTIFHVPLPHSSISKAFSSPFNITRFPCKCQLGTGVFFTTIMLLQKTQSCTAERSFEILQNHRTNN